MMKRNSILAGFVTALALTSSLAARETVIGLSPHQSPDAVKSQIERVVQHLVRVIEPGETAYIFDAARVNLIGSFVVPDKSSYTNPRAKLQANKPLLSKLKRFFQSAEALPGRQAHINLPGLLKTLREHYPSDNDRALIILGAPIYHDLKAPSVSMLEGRVPNDGHVSATIGQSPYGTKGIGGTLKGTDVYFGVIGKSDWAVSTEHAFHTERFWSLSIEGHGGSLHYFGGDLATLFRLAAKDQPDRKHSAPLVPTDKLEMLHFVPDDAELPDIQSAETEDIPPATPIWRAAQDVRIGLTWDCLSCDLDLFIRPAPESEIIYFANPNTSEGRLYKDFRQSPSTGFETVELNGPFDLSLTRIGINFYDGKSTRGKVEGELRIAIGEQVWAIPFVINAEHGNRGKGAKEAMTEISAPNAQWVIIDPVAAISGE